MPLAAGSKAVDALGEDVKGGFTKETKGGEGAAVPPGTWPEKFKTSLEKPEKKEPGAHVRYMTKKGEKPGGQNPIGCVL